MRRITTLPVDIARFDRAGASAAAVIKLMMACNDMQLANECLAEWKGEQPWYRQYRAVGAKMYFVRLEVSHLFEALKIVEQIRNDKSLKRFIEQRCGRKTNESFSRLEEFLPNGIKRKWLETMIGKLRHNLVFHYDESHKLVVRAVSDRAEPAGARHSSITRGSTAYLWHFKVADDILDEIVVRQIWTIPKGKDLGVEADRIADQNS